MIERPSFTPLLLSPRAAIEASHSTGAPVTAEDDSFAGIRQDLPELHQRPASAKQTLEARVDSTTVTDDALLLDACQAEQIDQFRHEIRLCQDDARKYRLLPTDTRRSTRSALKPAVPDCCIRPGCLPSALSIMLGGKAGTSRQADRQIPERTISQYGSVSYV
ncbi:hypothetical protein CDEST_09268 [Colletotrichum destructivum]|uniref:Uncharacterized protein n=1 Tax=Colletotrichum destructivum TaxID=34406 RepID=A0AAX4ILN5_9PEZI|nr:hypothetical protein CDEST_09268 [Colletotrichum destructivum]